MPATKDENTQVILVNDRDEEIGRAEKLAAHEKGLLHRAFSIFILRREAGQPTEVLLQQRAASKYHSPGLWTNTCCSHPAPGENLLQAAMRRLKEELNLIGVELSDIGQFHYIAHFENGLIENEYDHVLVGWHQDQAFTPNPEEIQACRWITLSDLEEELGQKPEQFTPWLKQALGIVQSIDH